VLQCDTACCSVCAGKEDIEGCTTDCFAVCCSVLQCVAVCCSVLQCVTARCSALQCFTECYSVLQHHQMAVRDVRQIVFGVLQCVTVCCNGL